VRVDLILPSERRSASPVSLKSGARLLGIGLLTGAAVWVGASLAGIADLRGRLRQAEEKWAAVEPRQQEAIRLIKEATENITIYSELEKLGSSRLAWHSHLSLLAGLVPEEIQLLDLSAQQEFQVQGSNSVARAFTLTLSGRSAARGADLAVEKLRGRLQQDPVVSPLLESIEVPKFGEDARNPADRAFQMTCKYRPRSL
jgi:hypothetical protein